MDALDIYVVVIVLLSLALVPIVIVAKSVSELYMQAFNKFVIIIL